MAQPRHGSPRYPGYGAPGANEPQGKRRWGLIVTGAVLLLIGVAGLWVAVRSFEAAHAMRAAKSDLAAIPDALAAGDVARATELLDAAQQETSSADSASHDPLVSLAAHAPIVGATPRALGVVSATANDLTHGAFVDLIAAGTALDPSKLRTSGDTVNLDAFRAAQPHLQRALTGLQAAGKNLDDLNVSSAPNVVRTAVDDMTHQLGDVTTTTSNALAASQLAVPMLGAEGPRRYFLALQTNNELRGTGGLLGQWGILSVDKGRVRLVKFAQNSVLSDQEYDNRLPVDFGQQYNQLYGIQPGLWASANLSPNYPYAAQLWLKMYQDRTGERLDGVITTDPVTLSYLLAATGPIQTPGGRTVSASNVVPYTESNVYQEFAGNDPKRKAVLEQVARSALEAILSGRGDAAALVNGLARSASERRLLIYSDHPDEQRVIATTEVSGEVPQGPGPMAGLGVINAGGNKLDYYLDASMDYQVVGCRSDGSRLTRITLTVDNTAPAHGAGLPLEVIARLDWPLRPNGLPESGHGQSFDYVQVYAAQGATLVKATQDGKPADVLPGEELDHPVYRVPMTIDAQGRTVLTFDLLEPASSAPVATFATPMVKSVPISADSRQCPVPG